MGSVHESRSSGGMEPLRPPAADRATRASSLAPIVAGRLAPPEASKGSLAKARVAPAKEPDFRELNFSRTNTLGSTLSKIKSVVVKSDKQKAIREAKETIKEKVRDVKSSQDLETFIKEVHGSVKNKNVDMQFVGSQVLKYVKREMKGNESLKHLHGQFLTHNAVSGLLASDKASEFAKNRYETIKSVMNPDKVAEDLGKDKSIEQYIKNFQIVASKLTDKPQIVEQLKKDLISEVNNSLVVVCVDSRGKPQKDKRKAAERKFSDAIDSVGVKGAAPKKMDQDGYLRKHFMSKVIRGSEGTLESRLADFRQEVQKTFSGEKLDERLDVEKVRDQFIHNTLKNTDKEGWENITKDVIQKVKSDFLDLDDAKLETLIKGQIRDFPEVGNDKIMSAKREINSLLEVNREKRALVKELKEMRVNEENIQKAQDKMKKYVDDFKKLDEAGQEAVLGELEKGTRSDQKIFVGIVKNLKSFEESKSALNPWNPISTAILTPFLKQDSQVQFHTLIGTFRNCERPDVIHKLLKSYVENDQTEGDKFTNVHTAFAFVTLEKVARGQEDILPVLNAFCPADMRLSDFISSLKDHCKDFKKYSPQLVKAALSKLKKIPKDEILFAERVNFCRQFIASRLAKVDDKGKLYKDMQKDFKKEFGTEFPNRIMNAIPKIFVEEFVKKPTMSLEDLESFIKEQFPSYLHEDLARRFSVETKTLKKAAAILKKEKKVEVKEEPVSEMKESPYLFDKLTESDKKGLNEIDSNNLDSEIQSRGEQIKNKKAEADGIYQKLPSYDESKRKEEKKRWDDLNVELTKLRQEEYYLEKRRKSL